MRRRICLFLAACIPAFLLSGCGSEFRILLDKDDYLPAIIFTGSHQPVVPGLVAITAPNSGADFTTNAASQTISGTCSTNATMSTSISSFTDSNCSDGTWAIAPITLSEGPNSITVTATDTSSNTASDTITIILDRTGPSVAITAPNNGADFTTDVASQTISGTCDSDATMSVSGGHTFSDSNCSDGTWTLAPMTLSAGANPVTVTAADPLSNAASDTITITYTTGPAVAITAPSVSDTFETNLALQTISGTCSINATMSTDTGSFTDSDCSDGTWALAPMTLSAGANPVTVTATDISSTSDTITITYTPPTATNTVYWSELTGGIKRINTDGTGETTLLTSSGIPLDIDLDIADSEIYWAEYTGTVYQIYHADLGAPVKTAFWNSYNASSYHGPTEIAIDPVARIIYWNVYQFSSAHPDIWRSSLSSPIAVKWEKTLPYNYIFSIALDSVNRMIYFNANTYWDIGTAAGSGKNGEVYSANMDIENAYSYKTWGMGPSNPSVSLRGIAVDAPGGYVYYVNNSGADNTLTIKRRNLLLQDSSEAVRITANGFDIQKLALDLDERKIYWTSRSPNRIYRADLDHAETGIEVFRVLSVVPTGIAISD